MEHSLQQLLTAGADKDSFRGRKFTYVYSQRPNRQTRNYRISRILNPNNVCTTNNDNFEAKYCILQLYTIEELNLLLSYKEKKIKKTKEILNFCKERKIEFYDFRKNLLENILKKAKKNKIDEATKIISDLLDNYGI